MLYWLNYKIVCADVLHQVHRLDRDCSGILVLGRNQLSTSMLHAIFREKTADALADVSSIYSLFIIIMFNICTFL